MSTNYVICINNSGYPAALEVRKVYEAVAGTHQEAGFLRVIDESGEDYLYPAENFVAIDLPAKVREAFQQRR